MAGGLAILLAASWAGCERPAPHRPRSGDIVRLEIEGHEVLAEVAMDPDSRARGLMFRESLDESRGMLFVYRSPQRLSFWMRDTVIPLSIAFIDSEGTIRQIEDMRPKDETPIVSKFLMRYALEMNRGWFQRHGIEEGDTFSDFSETVSPYASFASEADPRGR